MMTVNPAPWPAWFRNHKPRPVADVITYAAHLFDVPRSEVFSTSRLREHVLPLAEPAGRAARETAQDGSVGL